MTIMRYQNRSDDYTGLFILLIIALGTVIYFMQALFLPLLIVGIIILGIGLHQESEDAQKVGAIFLFGALIALLIGFWLGNSHFGQIATGAFDMFAKLRLGA